MKSIFYWFVKGLAWPVVRAYLGFRRHDKARVPARGACIVVANHSSYLDAICLGSACPRRLNFLIADEIYRLWRLRWFYYMMGAIPLRTEGADTRALRRALEVLESGGAVGIFPEGRRMPDGSIGEGKMGAAFLAWRSGAPVIPAAIVGAHHAMPVGSAFPKPRRIRVFFGEVIRFPEAERKARREALVGFADQLMEAVSALVQTSGERPSRAASSPASEEGGR